MALRPKSKLKSGSKKTWSVSNGKFTELYRKALKTLKKRTRTLGVLGIILVFFFMLSSFFRFGSSTRKAYGSEHGYYINEIPAQSPLIFPEIRHAPILKEMGVGALYTWRTDGDGSGSYVWKSDEKPLTDEEKKKTTDQVLLVKKSFLDHGKLVYKKENDSPQIVIVTLIDFESSELETMFKIVQNRVDYAQKHKYGIYIRWIQEFIPMLKAQTLQGNYEFVKPLAMRAAMHAFPQAKHIFFLEDESLIMNLDLSLDDHLLNPNILDIALLRNEPVVVNSNIRTYTHFKVEDTKYIIPRSPAGQLDLSSFVVSTDLYGRALLEFMIDPLFRSYTWESFQASVAHILQWHPQILGKTALVHQKLIAAPFNPNSVPSNDAGQELDAHYYTEGDLVVSVKGCKIKGSCAQDIASLYEKVRIH